jgi:hypothetical protein
VTNVRGGLPWFLSHHDELWVNSTESVNDYFSFYGLDRINDNSDGTFV